ncbi:MAG: hydrogenase nickel incorporation protein HypB [Candidatus Eremiobacterota bacterium]
MCGECGCSDRPPLAPATTVLPVDLRLTSLNDRKAEENRAFLASRGLFAVNLLGSPGSGKTALLESTLRSGVPLSVVEGDQATERDADRIRAAGGRVVTLNTGTGCHLEAGMVGRALEELDPRPGTVVVVENVGNLICPSMFDLGESARVAVLSTAEGEDKPLKYPHCFRSCHAVVLSKTDLIPHLDFDLERCRRNCLDVNPDLEILELSARTGQGMDAWLSWLGTRAHTAGSLRGT